jgi:integrase
MRGHIRQRAAGSWTIEASAGFDDGGRRVRIARTVHGSRRDAERALTRLLRDVDQGTVARSGGETFGAYLVGTWLPFMRARVHPDTWKRYESVSRVHIVPRIGRVKLSALRPHHLQRVEDEVLTTGAAPRTVLKVHLVMKAALTQAVRWQLLAVSPAVGVSPPRAERPALRIPDAREMRLLVDEARGTPWGIPVLLAASTGARRVEILRLRWREVDLEAGTCTIERGKTSSSRRTIHLPATTVAALRRHRKDQTERRLLLGQAWQEHDVVCDRGDGTPIDPQSFTYAFRRLAARVGLPGVRLHDMRHGFATELLRRGVPVKVVSEALGHSRAAITLDVYAAVLPGMGEQVADAIEAALGGEPRG